MTSYTSTLTRIKQEGVKDLFHPSPSLNASAASYHGASMPQSQQSGGQILQPASITGQIGQAMLKPTIIEKCQALTSALADNSNIKELQYQYPIIVQKILGFGAYQPGWQVEKMHIKTSRRDSNAIHDLLHPDGPFFKNLIYKLLGEEVSFEFPYEFIPEASRRRVEEALPLSELYSSKLQPGLSPTRPILALDAFEYYFFIFSHKMVSSSTKSQEIYMEPSDWLYPMLLNVYLGHFLPLSGMPQSVAYSSPKQPSVSSHRPPAAISTPRRQGMCLLKQNTPQLSRSVSMQASTSDSSIDTNVMWRSEKLVQVLAEMWMGQTSLDVPSPSSSLSFNNSMLGLYAPSPTLFDELSGASLIDLLYPSEQLPSHDLIMLVRMLVKHLHAFVHSSDGNVLPSHQQNPVTVLGALKRSLLGRYVQKPLYSFLKHSIEKWPLDTSFRPILELWLSFLRPWRYASSVNKTHSSDSADDSSSLDSGSFARNWSPFVKAHSLFYTVMFQEVLARFLRIDLASSKMSFHLSRVCRVFSLQELVTILRDVDMSAMSVPYELRDYQSHSYTDVTGGDDSQLALTSQINTLEATTFVYRPMFCEEVVQQVQLLLKEMVRSQQSVQSRLNSLRNKHRADQDGSFLTYVSQSFASLIGMGQLQELNEATSGGEVNELTSVDKSLQQSVLELCVIFNIEAPEYDLSTSAASIASDSLPDHVKRSDGRVELTDLGRYQVLNRLRKFQNIESKCDQELQPVRSYESDIGVIQLYKLSCSLNKKFGEYFSEQYSRDGIAGCVARRLLLPPLKDGAGGSYPFQKHPRISLRILANYYFIGYSILAYLLVSTAIGRLSTIALFALIFVLYVLTLALRDHIREARYK